MYNNRYRFILTEEQEQQTLIQLREARAFQAQFTASQSDLQPGAMSVAISRYLNSSATNMDMKIAITYGPNLTVGATVDTGDYELIMNDFNALQEAQPGIEVLDYNATTGFNDPAYKVRGNFTLHVINSDGSQEDLTLEAEFFACIRNCHINNIGMSNGLGTTTSPFKNQQGIEYITYDLPKDRPLQDRMILQPAYKCNDLDRLFIDDRGQFNTWPFVFINSLKVDGVQTAWATGKNGPPQNNGCNGTMGMLDTGGGPLFLVTNNTPGFPTLPPPQYPGFDGPKRCKELFGWAFNKPYEGPSCYWGDVEFQLQSAASNVTKTIRWTNEDVAGDFDYPTFIAFKKAPLGQGNNANLGTVMFALNKITMSVNTKEVCIESVAPSPRGLCEGFCQGTSATHFGCRADVPGYYALGCNSIGGCYYRQNENDPYPNEGFCTYKGGSNYGGSRPIEGPKTAKKAKKHNLKKD